MCQFWFSKLLIAWYLVDWVFLEQGGTWWQCGSHKWYAMRKKFGNHWCRLLTTWKKAHHRIHVKRAVRKIKQCHIFDQNIPVSMLGVLNELWLVWCFSRSNYYFRHCSIKHCFWNFVTSHEVWWQMIKQNILYYNIYWQTWHKQKYLWKLPEIFMTREKQFPTMKSRVVRVLQRLGERYLLSSGL